MLDAVDDNKFFGGIFSSKGDVSLEFSEGASFDDPDGHLEGKGKARRHLKFKSISDIVAKDVSGFFKQAIKRK